MMELLLLKEKKLFWKVIAGIWIIACVVLLVRTLFLRNGTPQTLGDAMVVEWVLMSILSYPSSMIPHWLEWPTYPHNATLTIIYLWILYFVIGYIQWFVIVPWIVHKGYDLYGSVALRVRRNLQGRARRR